LWYLFSITAADEYIFFLEHADELHMINIKEERGKEPHKHIPNQFSDVINIPTFHSQ